MTDIMKFGLYLIFAGIALLIISSFLSGGKAEFGGLIMIGPIPIAFGTSPEITVIAMAISLALTLMLFLLRRKYA